MTVPLSHLPKNKTGLQTGWRMVKFGEVVRNVQNNIPAEESGLERYVAGEHMETDDLHIRSWGTIGEGYLGPAFHRKFTKGQVLYGSRRTYLRKVALAEFDGICANTTFTLEPNGKDLIPELLPFIMQTDAFNEHAVKQSRGSVNPYVNWKDLAWYEFPLPPLDEQRRIAEILWAADEAIEGYKVCGQKVSELTKLTYEEWIDSNSNNDSWLKVNLKEVCTIQNGQVDPTIEPYSQMIHIAPDDIETETGNILEMKKASEDNIKSGKYEFSEKAILYSKIRPNLRKVAFPQFSGVCSADVYPLYAKPQILPDYLFYLLLSENFTNYAESNSVRSAIPKLNRPALLTYNFKLPPLRQQIILVQAMAGLSLARKENTKHLKTLFNLKKELLAKFSSGWVEWSLKSN